MYSKEALYLHGLNLIPQFGPVSIIKLCNYFPTIRDAYNCPIDTLKKANLEEKLINLFIERRKNLNLQEEAQKLAAHDIQLLSFKDENYPKLLLEIPKFPPLLYTRGKPLNKDDLCIAVVGTRKITTYGLSVIPDIVSPLVDAGITIISGMAFGVDSQAHKQAILKNKCTIAVLGGGLDDKSLYPKHHQLLAKEILDSGGTLISEYPIGTPNFKQNFVARNRIISGLSVATLVIECDLKSGSLLTAKHALDQNRQVYAVPGPIYSEMSKGPNNLIKMGAEIITSAKDIFEDLNLKFLPEEKIAKSLFGDTEAETKILSLLTKEPVSLDTIIKLSGFLAAEVISTLTFLELKGKVRNLGAQQYVIAR